MKTKIRVLLAGDHVIVREGIRRLLESGNRIEVVAEAGDGEEAQSLIQKHLPAAAVLDMQLNISDRTVQDHLAHIFDKMQATSRTEAVMRAVSLGWISQGSNKIKEE